MHLCASSDGEFSQTAMKISYKAIIARFHGPLSEVYETSSRVTPTLFLVERLVKQRFILRTLTCAQRTNSDMMELSGVTATAVLGSQSAGFCPIITLSRRPAAHDDRGCNLDTPKIRNTDEI